MAKFLKFKKVTSANFKSIGVPKTQLEKYDKFKSKNPAIEKLKKDFDLDIEL
jgi:hypothetical protein